MILALHTRDPEDPRCWWCGAPADSREHKFKAAELREQFGSGAWVGEKAVSHRTDAGFRDVKSARAERLTWEPSMCRTCNGARSQPMDMAVDRLRAYLTAYEEAVIADRGFWWRDVFGADAELGRSNVHGYWVKSAICRVLEGGQPVPSSLIEWISGSRAHRPPNIWIEPVIQRDMLRIEAIEGAFGFSLFGDLYLDTRFGCRRLSSHLMWRWFRVNYVVDFLASPAELPAWGACVSLREDDLDTDPADLPESGE